MRDFGEADVAYGSIAALNRLKMRQNDDAPDYPSQPDIMSA